MTSASTPERTSRRARTRAGVKAISFAPPSFTARTAPPGGMPPASTTWPTRAARQTRTRSPRSGCMVIRFTPNGRSVSACVPAISASNSAGVIAPQAITPNPPALEIAATRWRSLTQLIAPPMMAYRHPRNAVPRSQSRSRVRRAEARSCNSDSGMLSGGIETVGRVQRAHRELGVVGGDKHTHLDFACRDHLDVDRPIGQRAEHRVGYAGMAAHADTNDRNLRDIRVRQ